MHMCVWAVRGNRGENFELKDFKMEKSTSRGRKGTHCLRLFEERDWVLAGPASSGGLES